MMAIQLNYSFLLALLIGCCFVVTTIAVGPQVNTTVGMIEGSVESVTVVSVTRDINIFWGVPYAEPPIGDRRFKLSESKERMSGLYNATEVPSICPQDLGWLEYYKKLFPVYPYVIEEDCLYLNIYAPVDVSTGSPPRAVMIFIHGGAYLTGTASIYDGSVLAAIGDVVVVTINYRLGALGFLSSPDMDGNFGLFDQFLAIKWVSDNIEKFGGDKEKITLFGESAGSSSIALHSISDNNHLFKRVILESGSTLNPWSLASGPQMLSTAMSTQLDCGDDLAKLYDCLRAKPVAEILSTQKSVSASLILKAAFGPVVGKSALPNSPVDLYNGIDPKNITKTFSKIDHLIGTNSQEGAFIYNSLMGRFRGKINDSLIGLPRFIFNLFIEETAKQFSESHPQLFSSVIKYQYTDHADKNDGFKTAKNYINSLSDFNFYKGILQWSQFHAKAAKETGNATAGSTYFYLYDHSGSWVTKEPWREGADHADELPIVFGFPFILSLGTQEEKDLSAVIMTFWTNFAKTGDPNLPNTVTYPVTWPKYVIGEESYIRLSTDKTVSNLIGQKLFADRVTFWADLIPDLLSSLPAPTTPKTCPVLPTSPCPTGGAVTSILSMFVLSFAIFSSLLIVL